MMITIKKVLYSVISFNFIYPLVANESSLIKTNLQLEALGLTLSIEHSPSFQRCLEVVRNLDLENKKKIGDVPSAPILSSSHKDPLGEFYQTTLMLNPKLLASFSPPQVNKVLMGLPKIGYKTTDGYEGNHQKAIFSKGTFIICKENSPLEKTIRDHKFIPISSFIDLETDKQKICFYKSYSYEDLNIGFNTLSFSITLESHQNEEQKWEKFENELKNMDNLFGIFLLDRDGQIKGGLFGNHFPHDRQPHTYISSLWIDQTALKGERLGTLLITQAEYLARAQGSHWMNLDTIEFQAPGFYHKCGYTVTGICPNFLTTLDKKSHTLYDCRKKILEDPRQDLILSPYRETYFSDAFFIRPLFPQDYVSIIPLYTNPQTMKYWGPGKTYSEEETKDIIYRVANKNLATDFPTFYWAIITHQGIAGQVNIWDSGSPALELAYGINPAFGGRGLATAAAQLALNSKKGPFVATVHPENIPSREVLKKLGFKADPSRMGVAKYGTIRDYYQLGAKTSEMIALRPILPKMMGDYFK